MLKKIVLGILFAGLIAILFVGGAIRTLDKDSETDAGNDHGSDHALTGADDCSDQEGHDNIAGGQAGEGQARVDEWLELAGTATTISAHDLVIELDTGETVSVTGRAWQFAQQNDFTAAAGDSVKLIGFYEGERLEIGEIVNKSTGQTILIRDESGRPLWSVGRRES
jgi:hypothetical protein